MENVVYQDLYKFNFLSDPVVSPDGAYAIFTKQNAVEESNSYTAELWIIDLTTGKYHPLTTGGKERLSCTYNKVKDAVNSSFHQY